MATLYQLCFGRLFGGSLGDAGVLAGDAFSTAVAVVVATPSGGHFGDALAAAASPEKYTDILLPCVDTL